MPLQVRGKEGFQASESIRAAIAVDSINNYSVTSVVLGDLCSITNRKDRPGSLEYAFHG